MTCGAAADGRVVVGVLRCGRREGRGGGGRTQNSAAVERASTGPLADTATHVGGSSEAISVVEGVDGRVWRRSTGGGSWNPGVEEHALRGQYSRARCAHGSAD